MIGAGEGYSLRVGREPGVRPGDVLGCKRVLRLVPPRDDGKGYRVRLRCVDCGREHTARLDDAKRRGGCRCHNGRKARSEG